MRLSRLLITTTLAMAALAHADTLPYDENANARADLQ